jgi:hypothetical protein
VKRCESLFRSETLGGYGVRKFLEVREVGKLMRLGSSEKFLRLVRSRNLGGREDWKDREGGSIDRCSRRQ